MAFENPFFVYYFESAKTSNLQALLIRSVNAPFLTIPFVVNIKPWPNGPASNRKWTQTELAYRLALGGQTNSQVSSQVHAYPLYHWLPGGNNRLMKVTRLALTWVGWPNGEKHACYQLASTCDSVWPGLNTKPVRAIFL